MKRRMTVVAVFGLCLTLAVVQAAPLFVAEADAYGQSNGTGNGLDTKVLVKYSDGSSSDYHRKAWVRYDIASRSGRALSDAVLSLEFIETGIGANALGTWEFEVYGLTDDSLDGWTEAGFTWSNAPANNTSKSSGNGVIAGKTASLGTFSVSGKGLGTQTLSGLPVAAFAEADANGLATMIVVRNTQAPNGSASYNYAQGFATRQTATPPTLSLVEDSVLANGELEAGGATSTSGWTVTNATALAHDAIITGSQAAVFMDSSQNGQLRQAVTLTSPEWVFETYFATDDGNGSADDRGLNFLLQHPNGQINLRVNGQGVVQAYNNQGLGGSTGWKSLTGAGAVLASADADGDNDFTSAGDTLNVHRLRVVGHGYGTAAPTYDVLLSAANDTSLAHIASGIQFFQNGVPTSPAQARLNTVLFETQHGTGDYAVDACYLAYIPEPATVGLLAFGALALARRRRRS